MAYLAEESIQLYKELRRRGFEERFCRLIAGELRTTWTANRTLGYLRNLPVVGEEDIVDEMLGILSDRDRIMQKKEMEFYQGKINEIYRNGLDNTEE